MMDVAGSDINNRGITRQTHGPLSDNCHIWDQFTIQNTTVTQLSITKGFIAQKLDSYQWKTLNYKEIGNHLHVSAAMDQRNFKIKGFCLTLH